MKKRSLSIIPALFAVLLFTNTLCGQSTGFSYQGSVNVAGAPANGNYDFEFVLFDALSAGNQVGSVLPRNNVAVANGIFAVQLDFGATFPGAGRFLEIRVRPVGQPGMTILTPRQPVDSSPYAIKSLNADNATNATQLGGVAANQFVVTTDPRMSNARTPTPGSGDYVQNRVTQQTATNFNISGNGQVGGFLSANAVNAETQYNLGGFNRILGRDGNANLFVGLNAGSSLTTGTNNTFAGSGAGSDNTSGSHNAFFGNSAGLVNTIGSDNSFFGRSAGHLNTGNSNSFFGRSAGQSNTIGQNNAFFGANAGAANTTALGNSFFGANAGAANITAMGNSFFGASAGLVNTGANNSFFGTVAGVANTTGFNNAFFGYWAGHDNTNGDNNAFFGRSAGEINTTGNGNTFVGFEAGDTNTTGSNNTTLGNGADVGGTDPISFGTAIGAGSVVTTSNSVVLGRATDSVRVPGTLSVFGGVFATNIDVLNDVRIFEQLILTELGSAGNLPLCRNSDQEVSTCSSSARYKKNIVTFNPGLDLIARLRPVTFDWKNGGMHDLGLVAEEVAEVEPLLTTTNTKGEIEGVKYDRVGVVLVNAVKEQQAQIEWQANVIKRQQQQIDALMKIVCASNTEAAICKEN